MALNIRFHNTLTNQTESFQPIDAPLVRMYSCGPTVYDFAHIGNFRTFIFADVLRRFLELAGYDVKHVMNITDVGHMTEDDLADGGGEDKMELAARRIKEDKKSGRVPEGAVSNPDDPYQIANYYTQAFLSDAKALGMKVAFEYPNSMPHATNCIDIMQDMIVKLLETMASSTSASKASPTTASSQATHSTNSAVVQAVASMNKPWQANVTPATSCCGSPTKNIS
jgi:cysteinyl-tRNA synthetase